MKSSNCKKNNFDHLFVTNLVCEKEKISFKVMNEAIWNAVLRLEKEEKIGENKFCEENGTLRRMTGGRIRVGEERTNEKGEKLCRWCEGVITQKKRRTFCREECGTEHRIRTSPSFARLLVFKRDKGICALCGIDTKQVAQQVREGRLTRGEVGLPQTRRVFARKLGGGCWDCDHIVSVAQGGGLCGLDNLRSLCIPCHRERTAQDRKVLSEKKAKSNKI
jgi:hypothetical protein